MWYTRMTLEEWFDSYQYVVNYDIGESAVKYLTLEQIGIDVSKIPLRYGFHTGRPELRECLAEQYPGLTPDQIIVTSGASEANFSIVSALVKPGDHVVVEHPNYTSMYEVPRSMGCEVSLLTLKFEDGFKPDLDRLSDMITPETKLVSLTHPNNPTGSMISEKELRDVIDIVESKNTYLLFDETYRDLEFDNPLPPAATLSSRVVSISSMSKCYGIPGIRIGWAATKNQFLLDSILAIREQVSITNNALSEEIALYVLKNRNKYLDKSKHHVIKNRRIVSDWIDRQEDFEWIYPEAGVVSFPRIKSHVSIDPEKLYRLLAEKYKTFVIPGRCFEMDNRHFRLGFGAMPEEIKTGLANVNKALQELI
ncbi:aminotransferase class I/II-fold pyridoxal phosphate-dependent enzyme [Candidatus Latescibacterota bacterium]